MQNLGKTKIKGILKVIGIVLVLCLLTWLTIDAILRHQASVAATWAFISGLTGGIIIWQINK